MRLVLLFDVSNYLSCIGTYFDILCSRSSGGGGGGELLNHRPLPRRKKKKKAVNHLSSSITRYDNHRNKNHVHTYAYKEKSSRERMLSVVLHMS